MSTWSRRRAACPEAAHLSPRDRSAASAGRRTARASSSSRAATANSAVSRSSSRCRSTAAFRPRCRCRWATKARISPDGTRLAYVPLPRAFQAWKRYRGGMTTPIWIADLADSAIEKIPRDELERLQPDVGRRPGLLPLRPQRPDHALRLRHGDEEGRAADPEQRPRHQVGLGRPGRDRLRAVRHAPSLRSEVGQDAQDSNVTINGDLLAVRPKFEKVAPRIINASISPTGARAVFEARGEILTVPAEKGDVRNLTNTPGVAERDPAWSPDGKWIAYFSDESGEYALHLRDQTGRGEVKKINLGSRRRSSTRRSGRRTARRSPTPTSGSILWYVDIDEGHAGEGRRARSAAFGFSPSWSPDSRWIAYIKPIQVLVSRSLPLLARRGKSHQVTDGMSDARTRRSTGTASTCTSPRAPTSDPRSSASTCRAIRTGLRAASTSACCARTCLRRSRPRATKRRSQAEKPAEKPAEKKPEARLAKEPHERVPKSIDFEHIGQRILALPIPARNYVALDSRQGKHAFHRGTFAAPDPGPPALTFTSSTSRSASSKGARRRRRLRALGQRREDALSARARTGSSPRPRSRSSRAKARSRPTRWKSTSIRGPSGSRCTARPGASSATSSTTRTITARLEGDREEVRAVPRIACASRRPELPVPGDARRALGRPPVRSGRRRARTRSACAGGLLGADYKIENGRYRFAKIYNGENWNPQLRAPLTQPGVNVRKASTCWPSTAAI